MKKYKILIKDIHTEEKRAVNVEFPETLDVREIHKYVMKNIKLVEDIECIKLGEKLLYTIDRGFLV